MGLRALAWVILGLLSFYNVFAAAQSLGARELSISDIPPCGFTCLFQSVPISGCSFEDIECQCTSDRLKQVFGACMLANCTMADTLNTAKVQADLCHLPHEDRSLDLILYTGIIFSIAVLFVALRVVGKILAKRTSIDDWFIVFAMLLTSLPCGCILWITQIGFGKHIWDLERGWLKDNLMFFYIAWSAYVIVLGLIKVSLVLFYLQIFQSPKFRIASYIIIVFIIINNTAIFLVTIFSCKPIHSFWNRDIKGKCLDINAIAFANSGCAMFQDIVILVLPMFCIKRLNMRKFRKLAVALMFTIGTLGCIATGLRLRSLLSFKISIDPTWDYVTVTIWTEIELAAGFVCVCLPSIRILFTMILPRRLLSLLSHHRSQNDTPTPLQDFNAGQQAPKKSFSVFHIPTVSNGSSFWSSANKSQPRSQHRRLGSGLDPLDTMDHQISAPIGGPQIIATTAPPYREVFTTRSGRNTLQPPPRNPRQFCPSCGSSGDFITALPRIGCLPDANYSQLDARRNIHGPDMQRSTPNTQNNDSNNVSLPTNCT